MRSALTIIFLLLLSVINAQSYKGILVKDTLSGRFIYKRDCGDNLIVKGKSNLIKRDQLSDKVTNYLYEIKTDSIIYNSDSTLHTLSVYVLADKELTSGSCLFLLKALNYETPNTPTGYTRCLYYTLNGSLDIDIGSLEKTVEMYSFSSQAYSACPMYIKLPPPGNKKLRRDKYENIILRRSKK